MENKNFIGAIKLVTQEELIGRIIDQEANHIVVVQNPLKVVPVENETTQIKMKGFQLEPWIRSSVESMIAIDKDKIITVVEVDNDVASFYFKILSTSNLNRVQKTSSKKHNGYVTKVNQARMLLEKIYKSN